MHRRSLLAAWAAVACPLAWPHGAKRGELYIAHPHAYPGGPGDLAVFVSAIRNGERRPERLLSARSGASVVILQRRTSEGHYDDVPVIDIAPDQRLSLKSGDPYRLLLRGLSRPVKAGDRLPLTLVFEHAGDIDTEFHVQAPKGDAHAG
jgi:copper(I)-binding protein